MDYPWINTGLIILVDCWLKPLGYPTLSNYHCKDWRWIRHCLGFIFLLNNEHHPFLFLCFSAIPSRIHLIQTIAGVPSCSYVVLPMQYFKMIIYTYPFLDLDCRSEVTQPFFWERHTPASWHEIVQNVRRGIMLLDMDGGLASWDPSEWGRIGWVQLSYQPWEVFRKSSKLVPPPGRQGSLGNFHCGRVGRHQASNTTKSINVCTCLY